MTEETIEQQIQQLITEYLSQLPSKLQTLNNLWAKLTHDPNNEQMFELFYREIHNLAGSGANFGCEEVSDICRNILLKMANFRHSGISLNQENLQQIEPFLAQLKSCVNRELAGPVTLTTLEVEPSKKQGLLVYFMEDDSRLAKLTAHQLTQFDYDVRVFSNQKDFEAALQQKLPDAIVCDLVIADNLNAGNQMLQVIRDRYSSSLAAIICSKRDDYEARLASVKAGADAYITKPVDSATLAAHLDELTSRRPEKPYQILIVDDDEALSKYYSLMLKKAGMLVTAANSAKEAIDQLDHLQPDLIITDLYMPECSGLEFAQIIRQQDRFVSVPIIFLSTEENAERQFYALRLGGDDFLQKPIDGQSLVRAISIRAARARVLSNALMLDSLTGLLKHSKIKECLQNELTSAHKRNAKLAFAMIDIDHFKSVNDTYGHQSGDHIIQSLSRLLKNRLRQYDVVGRYGGEEFAVVIPDCDVFAAWNLVDELRRSFESILYYHGDSEFNVTFSAGVASAPPYLPLEEIIRQADDALYKAKHMGRNRVIAYEQKTKND